MFEASVFLFSKIVNLLGEYKVLIFPTSVVFATPAPRGQ